MNVCYLTRSKAHKYFMSRGWCSIYPYQGFDNLNQRIQGWTKCIFGGYKWKEQEHSISLFLVFYTTCLESACNSIYFSFILKVGCYLCWVEVEKSISIIDMKGIIGYHAEDWTNTFELGFVCVCSSKRLHQSWYQRNTILFNLEFTIKDL